MDKNLVNHQIILMRKDVRLAKRQTNQKIHQQMKLLTKKSQNLALKLQAAEDKEKIGRDIARITNKLANKIKDLEELKKIDCDVVSKQALVHSADYFKKLLMKDTNSTEDRLIAHICQEPSIKKSVQKFKDENPDSDKWLPVQLELWEEKSKNSEKPDHKKKNKKKDGKKEQKNEVTKPKESTKNQVKLVANDKKAVAAENGKKIEKTNGFTVSAIDSEQEEDFDVEEEEDEPEIDDDGFDSEEYDNRASDAEQSEDDPQSEDDEEEDIVLELPKPKTKKDVVDLNTSSSTGIVMRLNTDKLDEQLREIDNSKNSNGNSQKKKPKSSFFLNEDGEELSDREDNRANPKSCGFQDFSQRNSKFQRAPRNQGLNKSQPDRGFKPQRTERSGNGPSSFGNRSARRAMAFQNPSQQSDGKNSFQNNRDKNSSNGRFTAPPPPGGAASTSEEKLHPSWQAKMAQKAKLQKIDLTGQSSSNKRIKFD